MTMTPDLPDIECSEFRDRLDAWLAGEYVAAHMQQHHDTCAACRRETGLARAIGSITAALPQLAGPDIHLPDLAREASGHGLIAGLLQAWRRYVWRQPFVLAPAVAFVVAVIAWMHVRTPDTAVEPELVVIDGVEYTRDDIRKAAADLQTALRYIDRYRPARVISAELDTNAPPREQAPNERQNGADTPTI